MQSHWNIDMSGINDVTNYVSVTQSQAEVLSSNILPEVGQTVEQFIVFIADLLK